MAPPYRSFWQTISGLRPGLGSALGFAHQQLYEVRAKPDRGAAPNYFKASLRRGRANRLTSGGEAATQRAHDCKTQGPVNELAKYVIAVETASYFRSRRLGHRAEATV
jgi:hypothetical protein